MQKWLAPWVVGLLLEGVAYADLPPAPWQLGQTGKEDVQPGPPRPPQSLGYTIDPSTPVILPAHGGNAGSPFALTCGPDELVVGFWGRAGMAIDTAGLICARMRPNGLFQMPEKRPPIGSSMAEAFTLQCPPHEAVIGLRGRASMKLDRLGIACARIKPWVDQGVRGAVLTSVGGLAGTPFTDECPVGYLIQGALGFSNGTINGLQGLCVPIVR